jgi:type VI secretion system protein ImpH
MAGTDRAALDRLNWLAELAKTPWAFDFHVAMRRIENAYREFKRIGEALRPAEEPVRVGQDPSMAFATSEIESFKPPAEGKSGRLALRFFGLFGPQGPLPVHLTEHARERQRHAGDPTLGRFADIFHHRLALLFHRAWSTAQPTSAQDRPETNRFRAYVGSLFGLGLTSMQSRDALADEAKLQYAARFADQSRNPQGLQAIVAHYFGVGVTVEEFVGEWLDLPESGRWRLGHSRLTSTLAESTILGGRCWQRSQKFRIALGPLTREQFQSLLPGSEGRERLTALVTAYVGLDLHWDARLVLAPDASDQLQLARGCRLGWDSRLGKRGARKKDLIVKPSKTAGLRLAG